MGRKPARNNVIPQQESFTQADLDRLVDANIKLSQSLANNPVKRQQVEPSLQKSEKLADVIAAQLLDRAAVKLKDLKAVLDNKATELRQLKADLEALKAAFGDLQSLLNALNPILLLF